MRRNNGEKYGWKVVTILGYDDWRSPRGRTRPTYWSWLDCRVQYKLRQWTYPRRGEGPLCLFDTLRHAKNFGGGNLDYIFRCKYVPAIAIGDSIWRLSGGNRQVSTVNVTGKVLAAKIMLLGPAR